MLWSFMYLKHGEITRTFAIVVSTHTHSCFIFYICYIRYRNVTSSCIQNYLKKRWMVMKRRRQSRQENVVRYRQAMNSRRTIKVTVQPIPKQCYHTWGSIFPHSKPYSPRYNIILYHLTQKQLNNTINIFKSWAAKLSENLLLMFRSSSDPNKARFESFHSYFFGLISPVHNQITINKAKY